MKNYVIPVKKVLRSVTAYVKVKTDLNTVLKVG